MLPSSLCPALALRPSRGWEVPASLWCYLGWSSSPYDVATTHQLRDTGPEAQSPHRGRLGGQTACAGPAAESLPSLQRLLAAETKLPTTEAALVGALLVPAGATRREKERCQEGTHLFPFGFLQCDPRQTLRKTSRECHGLRGGGQGRQGLRTRAWGRPAGIRFPVSRGLGWALKPQDGSSAIGCAAA